MIRNFVTRHLIVALLLGVTLTAVLLTLFYGQYRQLAEDMVETSSAEHDAFLRESFRRRSLEELSMISADLGAIVEPRELRRALERELNQNEQISGLRVITADATRVDAGRIPETPAGESVSWLPGTLVIGLEFRSGRQSTATLIGAFSLRALRNESTAFSSEIAMTEIRTRRASFAWIGAAAAATLLVCLVIVMLLMRDQARRILELKRQAEKLTDADFGESLPETRGDALGDLATVFNRMREQLKATTLHRDYVDSILASMNDAVIVTDTKGYIKRVNKATTHLLGYEHDELLDRCIDDIVNTSKNKPLSEEEASGLPRETLLESKFGESIPVSYTCSIVDAPSGESGDRVYAAQNITERRRAEQRIRYLARIDALTKIPNRMQFQHLLQRAIARARRSGGRLSLFYIDVDNFKEINDTFGHLAGDTTLETVAERLRMSLPENTVIGRLAGDEFAVIIDGVGGGASARKATDMLATELLARLADPFFVQGHEVFMTASMGVASYPKHAPNVIDLIRNADAALYHAKKSGGNVHSYYRPEMNEAAVERLMTKSRLKRSFERDELLVHYQPKYNLETGEVFGAEALVRWELPERGVVLPSDFIPIAEETNLIIEIGEWVLDKVCEDFRYWQRSVSSPGRVSVNLSLKQLKQRNFIQRISAILRSYEVSPTSLELEITETTLMEDTERTIKILDELYALGLHLAIDDFGTGYSSLSALQQFPISTLKIDKSFVKHVSTSADDATLVATIVQMGQNMNMDVVAEGVESEEQLNFLQSISCTYAQGLLFGDPMSSDNYLELLLAQKEGTDAYRALFA
jgi:diguanylate cyclase (GGDEF)-like protein/PAS domain S-box-containing protein